MRQPKEAVKLWSSETSSFASKLIFDQEEKCLMGENTKGVKGVLKAKIHFQGFHFTHGVNVLVYYTIPLRFSYNFPSEISILRTNMTHSNKIKFGKFYI